MIKQMNSNETNFYFLMGKFFADRSIIKEMDCQLYNEEGMTWFVYFNKEGKVCGFASIQQKTRNKLKWNYLDNLYVVPEERGKGIGNKILQDVMKNYNNIYLITRNEKAIKMFINNGFFVNGAPKGRYLTMQKEQ